MSICRSSPFTSRTKSLRERFGSKRSYSESFKDPPVTAARKDTTGVTPSCPVPLPETGRQASTGSIRISELSADHFSAFAILPEETYCSALDINSQQGDPRFPWQRDVAIQCDLSPAEGGPGNRSRRNSTQKNSTMFQLPTSENLAPKPTSPLRITSPVEEALNKKILPRKKSSMLQRAMSLERGRSRQKLVHQMSIDESRRDQKHSQVYAPRHIPSLTRNPEVHVVDEEGGYASAPSSCMATPPSDTPPHTPPAVLSLSGLNRKPSVSERRKTCFMRSQTNSAPQSFEERTPQTPEKSTVGYFNFDSMQRLLDLSMTAAASQTGKLDNRTFLLSIPTPGNGLVDQP